MAPWALATADVTGASYDSVVWGGCVSQSSSVTSSILNEKKKPLYLSHGWCYDYHYDGCITLEYELFSADSSFSVFCRIRDSSSTSAFILFQIFSV